MLDCAVGFWLRELLSCSLFTKAASPSGLMFLVWAASLQALLLEALNLLERDTSPVEKIDPP